MRQWEEIIGVVLSEASINYSQSNNSNQSAHEGNWYWADAKWLDINPIPGEMPPSVRTGGDDGPSDNENNVTDSDQFIHSWIC